MRWALWLMDHFGVSEGLVGDLIEERSRERSALWLWRQALVAIVGTVARDIRAHKWLAARAVITSQLVAPIRRIVIPLISGEWAWTSEQWLDHALGFPVLPLPFLTVMSASAVITGWIVARLHIAATKCRWCPRTSSRY